MISVSFGAAVLGIALHRARRRVSTTALTLKSSVKLRNGLEMPLFGLGTWLAKADGECLGACKVALEHGYNMIDTATMYNNEQEVGAGCRRRRGHRADVGCG